ncbi:hypothetical protein A3K24_02520 [candidate division Kazan bacterium RIFCSPHIGHO2_01_FULL_44_14]|uniref:Uncharacterized protein n=1 Tax=candidate division Kazan bacterium RIFCSPLOWO2_01_FULL_45_19 TaxID=1798538 RepID=A0A1F4NQX7_UNCK3|nr:hypothetical protein [uncultured bacterium]AQS31113.1 hypothetical protein [uncultured bacterium]OGB73688.1 MAG: hypothetical protein A3K51_02520 [candidate division Kazan bacterium RIFCSPLOWO2_01_FULL_45_19]OGB77933.1 MAG: hypothetical protein A3K24_02520 [candidate division Kazan bacterium RIFCSPHIGHO2_01_FULL_44_14]
MQKSLTAGQIKQILGFLRDVLIVIGLGFYQAQAFINDKTRVDKFKEDFKALLNASLKVNPYIKERVKQAWFYPKNWKVKNVTEQLAKLTELFPGIDLSQVEALVAKVTLQKWHDGIAVLPKLSFLGLLWGIADPYGKGYGLICEKLFELIAGSRAFHNYRAGQMNDQYIRIMEQVREQLKKLEAETPGDVLVLAFDFGKTYAGYSPRNARHEALNNNQLPLITAQVASLLLTMPDRLTAWEQLFIDCSGDEWDWDAVGRWLYSVCFRFDDGRLRFDSGNADAPSDDYGSVVASLGSVPGV